MDIKTIAHEIQSETIALRRELHRHPEPSLEEHWTTERLIKEIEVLGLPYRKLSPTGLIAELRGGKPGRTVGLRADIDALSITENTGLPFSSEVPGVMHACGHDTHAAMLVGAAKVLCRVRGELCGSVRFIFQPAEEGGGGAEKVIDQGGLEGLDYLFGQHIYSQQRSGTIGWTKGAGTAAAGTFIIKVIGDACHGALPETGVDATVAAAAIVMALQTIVSRELSALDPAVVTVGKLCSGTRKNIVSGYAEIEGTMRSFDPKVHAHIRDSIERIARQTAAAYRCEIDFHYHDSAKVLLNNPEAAEIACRAAQKVAAAPDDVFVMEKQLVSEDFADYTPYVKAAFVLLGGGGEYPPHSDQFAVDETSFETGVAFLAQAAIEALNA
ncbi:M20 metallopeptidase family protein [Harryflintia acetispora]|uniref:M20 metallopeptidase family protein n=1 Tax=Harryflintia acetispora TaxID=1849041 RepID=UPI00189724A3|nr:amidohydrolase [Harryflintia acetispora]